MIPRTDVLQPSLRALRSVVVLLIAIILNSSLQGGTFPKTIQALRVDAEIQLDGHLDEPVWSQAQVVSDLIQRDPDLGQPVSERTEIRILLTDQNLYFGVQCFDSEPSKIIARERRRDVSLREDDRFEVILDTFHDHRNAYYFVTNPLGTRWDALITDERNTNAEWDERWWVEARINDEGWMLEIQIPLSSLRAPRDLDVWGINLKRFIRRKNELTKWAAWNREFAFRQVSQAGHLTGMEGVETGLKLRVKPYVLGGFRQFSKEGQEGQFENASEVGLEVARWGLTPGLVAEFTLNTDFAQVEVDEAVVNLTRFPLLFEERREFFLERAGFFDFSQRSRRGFGRVDRTALMYFSRRIGLTEDRRPVPVLGGAKLTGKLGGMELGLLNVQTRDFESRPGDNYTVARLKKNILGRSNIGTFVSNRQSASSDFNRVAGGEVNLTFFSNLDIHTALARSFTSGVTGDETFGRAKFNWYSDLSEVFLEHLYIGDEFRHDIGFIRRKGIRESLAIVSVNPRPEILGIRRLNLRNEMVYTTDTDGRLLTRVNRFIVSSDFHSGDVISFRAIQDFDQLEDDFPITPGITIPLDVYRFNSYTLSYQARPQNSLNGMFEVGWGDFYGGRRRFLSLQPTLKPIPAFSAELAYEYNDIDLPQGSFVTQVINTRFNLSFSNRWLTTSQIQYETESERLVFFFRLRFNYRPGDDLFIVFNQTNAVGSGPGESDRALLVKFTRTFDF
ncbi:MAG: DUF5916 domain-containing protein [Acidobacteriota bacterium]